MARTGLVLFGVFIIVLAVAGYITPLPFTIAGESSSSTIPRMVAICDSGIGQFAQLSPEMSILCSENKNLMFGIYGFGLLGIILIIVGAATGGKNQSEDELEERYSKGELTKGEFESKKDEIKPEEDEAIQILRERYAKGELSKDEFDKMKEDLEKS